MPDPTVPSHETLAARLAGVAAGSPLAEALAMRADANLHAEASAQVLFERVDTQRLSHAERFGIALATADLHADIRLSAHYGERLAQAGGPPPEDARWTAALRHVRLLVVEPVRAAATDLRALETAGWSADAILTLSQVVAYVSFQSRFVAGLALLADTAAAAGGEPPVPAGVWHTQPTALSGRPAPTAFTRDELGWEPWLAPRAAATLSPAETEQLQKAGHLQSDYFMLLARDTPVLDHRTRTDKGIFYTHGGLSRAERELAATVTSKVNGCIYCASVHARKAAQLSGEVAAADALLAVAPGGDLAAGQSPRWQAQIRFAAQLAATPSRLGVAELAPLQALGLTTLELLDLVGAVAFFSWANRLMLTLGEPFRQP
ncbi:alkylhydroperoxidase domain protein [Pseudorhodoferax sp. Leaf274]|uniref:alkylhydroperoxidase domain protein n=1 Tax=Pseudorhodoferax sp. Leaf274 TaxID=1736318 RepID=UPI0007025F67|nr:alkylhydroperoxidase domain protein [Pseudorhodoferax sp. Leaf274]KQP47720.1 alkylhydroperoxidase [Pseudorhodoferax sp. Leaf274]